VKRKFNVFLGTDSVKRVEIQAESAEEASELAVLAHTEFDKPGINIWVADTANTETFQTLEDSSPSAISDPLNLEPHKNHESQKIATFSVLSGFLHKTNKFFTDIGSMITGIGTIVTAIFSFLVWEVYVKQAEILETQTKIQMQLALPDIKTTLPQSLFEESSIFSFRFAEQPEIDFSFDEYSCYLTPTESKPTAPAIRINDCFLTANILRSTEYTNDFHTNIKDMQIHINPLMASLSYLLSKFPSGESGFTLVFKISYRYKNFDNSYTEVCNVYSQQFSQNPITNWLTSNCNSIQSAFSSPSFFIRQLDYLKIKENFKF
jgi:hypothetical protein